MYKRVEKIVMMEMYDYIIKWMRRIVLDVSNKS